ncbi:MAG: glycosyltransferase [Candidatus Hodarchaeota archaeon]
MKYAKPFKTIKDIENVSINDLRYIPLVNIIVPAWNEGEIFRKCLKSITELKYPKLNVIVNAGGSIKTINIANSFKEYDYFTILAQEGGGKIKALNECLSYITEGVLYLVDADVCFTDEILLRMLIPITNYNENVVVGGIRPFKDQENKVLLKYLLRNRNFDYRQRFSRYIQTQISGANTCITYKVMKAIGKFSENTIWAEDVSRGADILSKDFKIYRLIDYRARIYSKFPDTIKEWAKQKIRWNQNYFIFSFHNKKVNLIKIMILFLMSLYLIIFPILFLFHLALVLFGIYLIFSLYLKKLRKILFYKMTIEKQYLQKLNALFFLKIIIYMYIEALFYIYIVFESIFIKSKFNKRKNLNLPSKLDKF